jgi:ABC-type sugar transport system permease subunit/ABC-type glycerol-3-phosphate transport system substrate-binding protein
MLLRRTTFALLGLALLAAHAVAEDVTLRFTVWDGDESLKIIRSVLKQFEAANPGIKVKLENYADYNLYHQKMLVTYAANTAPDVAMMDMGHFQALANRKALLPLNDFFAKSPGFDIKSYYKPIVDAHSLDGKCYVLPRDIAPMGLVYYNKRLFKEAGIPEPDGSWTWDFKERPELKEKDFLWVMHKLTKMGENGKPSQYAFVSGWPALTVDTFMYGYSADPVDNYQHPTKVLYNSPEMQKVYDFYIDLALKKKWIPGNLEVTSVMLSTTQQLFVQQKVAMFQNGIWEVPNMRKMMKPGSKEFFDWDIALFPACARDSKGKEHRAFPTGGSGYSIFSSTEHPAEAWKLVQYMSGPVAMTAMAKAGIAQPAIRALALQPGIWIPGPDTPKEQLYPYHRIVTDQAVPYVNFGITADYWPEVGSIIDSRRDSIYNGIMTPKDGLGKATAEAQTHLDQLLADETLPPFPWPVGIGFGAVIVGGILWAIYWPERKLRYTNREKKESRTAYRFLSPWLIGLCVFTIGPMILSLLMSTMKWDMIQPAQFRGLGNFNEAVNTDARFWVSLRVTMVYTLLATPISIFFALLLAMLLNQKVKGVPIFRSMYYMPTITSAVAMAFVARKLFAPEGGLVNSILYSSWFKPIGTALSNWAGTPNDQVNWFGNEHTALSTLLIWNLLTVGGAMVIILAGLQGVPQFYYEAATVDGASPLQRAKSITFPLITPSLFFCLITGFIGAFQVFTQVYIITNGPNGGPNNSMLVFMISIWSAAFTTLRMGYAAALAWVLFFVVLIFTLIQLRMSRWVHYEADAK